MERKRQHTSVSSQRTSGFAQTHNVVTTQPVAFRTARAAYFSGREIVGELYRETQSRRRSEGGEHRADSQRPGHFQPVRGFGQTTRNNPSPGAMGSRPEPLDP